MNDRATATRAVLQALGQSDTIDTLDDRKRIQKIVYFAQELGIPLGYYFSWYLRGPYASSLARDYYNMPADVGAKLRPDLVGLLAPIQAMLQDDRRPQDMSDADWLETLASVHYLDRASRLDIPKADEKLQREKPQLFKYVPVARQVLNERILGGQPKAGQ